MITRITQKITKEMSGGAGTNKVELRGDTTEETEIIEECHEKGYILTGDDGVDSLGSTVVFPVDCKELRILGFFREKSSESWELYKNKVYSIGRRGKIFTLEARDDTIARHLKHVS